MSPSQTIEIPAPAAPARKGGHLELTFGSDPVIQQRVREEQFSLIFARTNRNSNAIAFTMALVLWLFAYICLDNPWALAWGGAIHGSQLARSFWVRRYFANPSATVADPKWVRGYILRLGINGAIWGSAPLVMFDPDNLVWVTLATVTVLAIFSGGQTWVAPIRGAVLAFCVPNMLQVCLAFALHDSSMFRVAAVLVFIYLSMSVRFALQHGDMLARAIYARLVNEGLNAELSDKMHAVERTSAEKSRFFAAASHDLRQPMHAIALFSASLEHDLRGTPHHESARRSLGAVRALSESLDAMLDVSKLDAGVVEVNKAPVSLQHVFQRLNSVLQPQATQKGLHLRFRSTPLRIHTDERHLERMLSNLAANAIKYTHQGGVLVGARRRRGGVAIEVWDTGVGIAADQYDKIFEEFYQLGNPGRDRSQGLGIGLAVVRRLSGLLGLPVVLHSRVGRGSNFRVIVPGAKVLAEMPPVAPEFTSLPQMAEDPELPKQVLVLDDEDDILAAVHSVLTGYGVEVLTASTCEQALSMLQEAPSGEIGALLCDLRLGGGASGLQFARSLAPVHGIHVPTIMVTGETGPEALREVRASGFTAVFKPVAANRLLAALADVSTSRRAAVA